MIFMARSKLEVEIEGFSRLIFRDASLSLDIGEPNKTELEKEDKASSQKASMNFDAGLLHMAFQVQYVQLTFEWDQRQR